MPGPGEKLIIPTPPKRTRAHFAVAKIALEMANEEYERYSSNNEWHKLYPNRKWWVRRALPYYIEPARATLVDILKSGASEAMKEEVMTILIADNIFRGSAYANEQIPN